MNTPTDREERAFRAVYAALLDEAPEPPDFELLATRQMAPAPRRARRRRPRGLALAGAALVILLGVAGAILLPLGGGTPSALATLEEARLAFTDVPSFRATLTGRVDGEILGEELASGEPLEDQTYVDELWYESESAWRWNIVEDSLPTLRGGPGSASIWDGSQMITYRADENAFAVDSGPPGEFIEPLSKLNPSQISWPVRSGGAEPSEEYFLERCEVGSDDQVAGRPARHLNCEGGYVEVWLDAETGLVLKAVGPLASHEVTELEYGPVFPTGTFLFEPPPGARSVEDVASDPYAQTSLVPGESAPAWEGPLVGGGTLRLEDLRGRPALVLLWADWCLSCIEESLPLLQELYDQKADEFGFVAIDFDGNPDAAQEIVRDGGYTFPVVVDFDCMVIREDGSGPPQRLEACQPSDIDEAWGIQSVPLWALLDGEGRVVELLGFDATLEELVQLLANHA